VIASDLVILVMFAMTLVYLLSRGRGGHASHVDTVVLRSIPGLIIAGTLFGALVVAMIGYGLAMIVLHPMEVTHTRIGPVHDWALGIGSLGLGIVFGIVPYALFGKLVRILGEQRAVVRAVAAARPVPTVVAVPRVADLAAARRSALARITPSATVDQLAATRFGGAKLDATELAAELRALVG
jgi:hypothetical protein